MDCCKNEMLDPEENYDDIRHFLDVMEEGDQLTKMTSKPLLITLSTQSQFPVLLR